jgi:hypothetical protein
MRVNYFRHPKLPVPGKLFEYLPHGPRKLAHRLLQPSNLQAAHALKRDMAAFISSRSVFVHIPKAAGISISQSLYGGASCYHTTSSWYALALTLAEIRQFFIYTIVRNPWDRLHSAYHFLKQGGYNDGDRYCWDKYLKKYKDFNEFAIDLPNAKFAMKNIVHLYPMHHFIELRPGSNILSYLGYYEDLNNAYSHIAERLNQRPTASTGLAHQNRTPEKARSYLTSYSNKAIDVVGNLYERDITLFGYTFDSFDRSNARITLGTYR